MLGQVQRNFNRFKAVSSRNSFKQEPHGGFRRLMIFLCRAKNKSLADFVFLLYKIRNIYIVDIK